MILTSRKYSFKSSTSFETDLNDHHHLIYSVLNKEEPKTLIYRDYKTFFLERFGSELFSKLELQENNEYETFEKKNFVDTKSFTLIKNLSR